MRAPLRTSLLCLTIGALAAACGPAEEESGSARVRTDDEAGAAGQRAGGASGSAGSGQSGGRAGGGGATGAGSSGKAGAAAGTAAGGAGGTAAGGIGGTAAGGSNGTAGAADAGVAGGAGKGGSAAGQAGQGSGQGGSSSGLVPTPVAGCPRVRVEVVGSLPVNIRPSPDTSGEPIGSVPNGTLLTTNGTVQGQAIEGDSKWYEVFFEGKKGYIGGIFVVCTTDEPPPADCPRVKLGGAGTLVNVRPDPNTSGAPVASLPNGTILTVSAKVVGEAVDGNTTWFRVEGQAKGFVSAAVAACTTEEPPKVPDGFLLPFACGYQTTVTQGNNTQFSHSGTSAYAFDFGVPMGTPVAAMAAGTVKFAYAGTKPGHPCYQGGGQSCINAANYVNIAHGDGTVTQYAHLSEVNVGVGATVARGQIIGKSGNTGWSTGAHLHAERQKACNSAFCQTIPLTFADAGVPTSGTKVTSGNCP